MSMKMLSEVFQQSYSIFVECENLMSAENAFPFIHWRAWAVFTFRHIESQVEHCLKMVTVLNICRDAVIDCCCALLLKILFKYLYFRRIYRLNVDDCSWKTVYGTNAALLYIYSISCKIIIKQRKFVEIFRQNLPLTATLVQQLKKM